MSLQRYIKGASFALQMANEEFDYSKIVPSNVSSKPLHERTANPSSSPNVAGSSSSSSSSTSTPTNNGQSTINLNKIRLDKSANSTTINLNKTAPELVINLNWSPITIEKKGFFSSLFGSKETKLDLDLGAFIRLNDGSKMLIDALQFANGNGGPRNVQTRQGCFTKAPFLWHTGDDRVGGSGETILVNPQYADYIDNIVVYCYIYEADVIWAQTDAVVTIKAAGQSDIEVYLGNENIQGRYVVLAQIFFENGGIRVERKMQAFNDIVDVNDLYRWGFRFRAGSK
ncbi:hypothetical protein CKF54_05440 [Psittacicella hinzii]|uniref:Tellurite resistance protein TerA n=1 Tax=Psittacicella hinzii TaxID=2028575 RepID=A0A3A1Y3F4_9GAMM|nr:stress protein [Psittacicella hinzii]RIY32095.1 hypothetical protein CKF54_05440 [Psittacicella hinzii]